MTLNSDKQKGILTKFRKFEFSKMVLSLVMVLFFTVAVFGMVVVVAMLAISKQNSYMYSSVATALGALFTFIGAPTGVAIGYYLWKSKNENIQKYAAPTDNTLNPMPNVQEAQKDENGVYEIPNEDSSDLKKVGL